MKVTDLCATAAEGKSCFSEGVSYLDPGGNHSSLLIHHQRQVSRSRPTHLQAACSPLRLLSGRQPSSQVAPPLGMARSATLSGPCLRGCAQSSGPGLWRWRSCAFSFGVSGWTGAELKWRSRFVAGSSLRFQHRLASSHRSGERALRKERAAVFGEAHLLASASEGVARSTIGGWRTRGGSKGRIRRSRRRLRLARVGTTDT
jgi:hypothetical protein